MKSLHWMREASIPLWVGAVHAFAGWIMIGAPPEYSWIAVCCGAALVASFSLFLFSRRHPRAPLDEEPTPEDRPRLDLPPGTRAERAADLRAMAESRITVEDFVDRWSGREILPDKTEEINRVPDVERCSEMLSKFSSSVDTKSLAGTLSIPVTSVSQFKSGQWVRLRQRVGWVIQKWEGELAEIIGPGHEEGLWDVRTITGPLCMSKFCLEPAIPKNGEVWEMVYCETHCPSMKDCDPKPCDTTKDWPEDCMARPYLRCGCIRPVNFGRGFPRTGEEYIKS
jgi:hypothetical protein